MFLRCACCRPAFFLRAALRSSVSRPSLKTFQPTFEMTVAIHRLPRRQLHPAAREAFVIRCSHQLAIQPWRRNFQDVRPPGTASSTSRIVPTSRLKLRAVFVRHPAGLVDEDPQHAGLAPAAQLNLDHFQPAGGRHALRNFPNSIDLKCHEINITGTSTVRKAAETKKWAFAHWCVSPNAGTTQQFPTSIYARSGAKDKPRRGSSRGVNCAEEATSGASLSAIFCCKRCLKIWGGCGAASYWKFEISTTLLLRLPRAKASCLPSSDQAKSKIRSVLKCVSCFAGPPVSGCPRRYRLHRGSRHIGRTCCLATRLVRTFPRERRSDRRDPRPVPG